MRRARNRLTWDQANRPFSRILLVIGGLVLVLLLPLGFLLAPVISAQAVSLSRPDTYRTKHVIVAVMDGVRYSETFGDPEHRYVSHMWKELVPQGTLYVNFYNRGVTVTRQGHSTIASGTWQVVPNGGPRLTMPTFFDYYREETGAPAEKTWAIFGKGSYSFAPYSSFPVYGDRWAPRAELGIGEGKLQDDRQVLDRILAVMKQYKPNLIFANFGYTDHSGHRGPFEEYTAAVANVDDIFAELWAAIQADPEYRDSTTLILTNDHGRHDDGHGGYNGHGCGCEGCRHIFLLIIGPDTKKGAIISQPASQVDICPTVGELLGFQTPLAEGRVLSESFVSFLGLNLKEARTVVEKEAVRVQELASRDLARAVTGYTISNLSPASLPPVPDAVLLFRGLLNVEASPSQNGLITQAAREWLEKTGDARGISRIYRALVSLDHARISGGKAANAKDELSYAVSLAREGLKQNGDSSQTVGDRLSSMERAFVLDLFIRLATTGDMMREAMEGLADMEKLLDSLAMPSASPKGGDGGIRPHEEALTLYALSDALLALERFKGYSQGTVTRKPLVAIEERLREVCLLRYYGAIQGQKEPGGLWQDPIESLLYLVSAKQLDAAGAFRGFRAQKKLEAGKEQDEKADLPPVVANMAAGEILAWTALKGGPGAGDGSRNKKALPPTREAQLRRAMASLIWEQNQYLEFSRELTRYLVDGAGQVNGDNPVLGAGSFLCLWSPIQ